MPLIACSIRFLVGDRIDVFAAHPLEDIAKQSEQPVGIGPVTVLGKSAVNAETKSGMPCEPTGRRPIATPARKAVPQHQGGAETPPGIMG